MESTPSPRPVSVRGATPDDVEGVAAVAYETAFFGASAAAFFPCPSLFADLWVRPYLRSGVGRVAVTSEGAIVGYCIGVDRPGDYVRGLLPLVPGAVKRLLLGECSGWRGALRYGLRLLRYGSPGAPLRDYPAHLHLALLEGARGLGAGRALLEAYLSAAAARGVRGVQLSTTERHEAAVGLYLSAGFERWSARSSPLWRPWTGRDETHLTLVLDLRTRLRR